MTSQKPSSQPPIVAETASKLLAIYRAYAEANNIPYKTLNDLTMYQKQQALRQFYWDGTKAVPR